jgi:hypothetical protein
MSHSAVYRSNKWQRQLTTEENHFTPNTAPCRITHILGMQEVFMAAFVMKPGSGNSLTTFFYFYSFFKPNLFTFILFFKSNLFIRYDCSERHCPHGDDPLTIGQKMEVQVYIFPY